jgi:hypothetical protein
MVWALTLGRWREVPARFRKFDSSAVFELGVAAARGFCALKTGGGSRACVLKRLTAAGMWSACSVVSVAVLSRQF